MLTLLSTQKIWDKADHAAFTDLIFFQNRWLCAFRESQDHYGTQCGVVRLLSSADSEVFKPIALLKEEGVDLRDPKLSITPDGLIMLIVGGLTWTSKKKYKSSQTRVAFSKDGSNWSSFQKILEPDLWLWRVTWHGGIAYGAAYRPKKEGVVLVKSVDGLNWEKICDWDIPGKPNEATLRFLPDNKMIALIRLGHYPKDHAFIGTADPDYTNWSWKDSGMHLGGPNFLILPNNQMIASGREVKKIGRDEYSETTVVAKMTEEKLSPLLTLPSGGEDTSYPGMVYKDSKLYISYYSSHTDDKASIYLSTLGLIPS